MNKSPHFRGRGGRLAAGLTAAVVMVGLAGCGGDNGSSTGNDGPVTIRFSWWGSNERTERMQQAIDLFEQANPDIKVEGDFAEWSGYWDKLATGVAGGDESDVFMQEDRYLGDYARRAVLADLGAMGVKADGIDAQLLSSGNIDGKQYGIPTGSNVLSMVANPALFEEAGVAMPDDNTWTWEDYERISEEISANTPDGVYGATDYSYNEVGFQIYARQHGQSLFAADGSLGYDDALLKEWFERSLRLQEAGGQPPADESVGLDLLDSPIAKRQAAMSLTWSSQVGALSDAAGDDMVLLKIPGETEFDRTGMYFKPGMYLSASAKSEHPEAAAKLIDFFVTSPDVGKIFGSELGLPGSAAVRDAIMPGMSDRELTAAEFVVGLANHIEDAPPALPNGAGDIEGIMQRINSEVLFGQKTPAEAAAEFRTEAEAAIG